MQTDISDHDPSRKRCAGRTEQARLGGRQGHCDIRRKGLRRVITSVAVQPRGAIDRNSQRRGWSLAEHAPDSVQGGGQVLAQGKLKACAKHGVDDDIGLLRVSHEFEETRIVCARHDRPSQLAQAVGVFIRPLPSRQDVRDNVTSSLPEPASGHQPVAPIVTAADQNQHPLLARLW
jgi:hypothetical protein